MIYYVSTSGNDSAKGTKEAPFKTINRAAGVAVAGDTVKVFGGVYREWVDPQDGGISDECRIVYEAVEGESPVIKGSEPVTGWEKVEGTVWKKVLPNYMFGDFNPFDTPIFGDWLVKPKEYTVHLGDVYLNGVSMYEAPSYDDVIKAEKRISGAHFSSRKFATGEKIRYPEQTVYQWYARVGTENTELFCNFREYDPNLETVEINVRPCCFFPRKTGIDYITVRGFEMAHAASPWAPPTADQIGMIGPRWSRGWIIEDNILHDAKCSAVCLGKEFSTGDNLHSHFMKKSGYQHQQESVFLALVVGWSRDTVGSHTVKNNIIYDCGQAGIVGHLGCAFSRIEHNHIYNINQKQEFWGHEIAGIKLHAAIDTVIEGNNIHNCNLGMWLDWEAQGTRVTKNVFHANARDLFIEVTHGPCLIDNNAFFSPITFQNAAQGTAYVHNLFCGRVRNYRVLDRATPYHYPHSTNIAGYAFVYGGDDRIINNIIIGNEPVSEYCGYFGALFDAYSTESEYKTSIESSDRACDHETFFAIPQPVWVSENAYSGYAEPYRAEDAPIYADGITAAIREENGDWFITLDVPAAIANADCRQVTSERLGTPRISEGKYENTDGSAVDLTADIVGQIRTHRVIPGPFAKLCGGTNRFKVWS